VESSATGNTEKGLLRFNKLFGWASRATFPTCPPSCLCDSIMIINPPLYRGCLPYLPKSRRAQGNHVKRILSITAARLTMILFQVISLWQSTECKTRI
jgi:hypothetical protein